MKQMRKLSNLIAEELINAGLNENDDAFESRVTKIANMVSEAVEDEKANEGDGTEQEDEVVLEDVDAEDLYMATEDATIGDAHVAAGEFVEVVAIDLEANKATINTYDEDGESKDEDIEVDLSALEDFAETAEDVDFEEEVEEDIHIKGGQKVKVKAAVEKLRAKLKAKKGDSGPNKFTIKNGKIVKKSKEQLKADKKKAKTFAKRMKKFKAKRLKSMKKHAKLVKDGFNLVSGDMTVALSEGDILMVEGDVASVTRNGSTLVSGIKVSENFIARCIAEGVIEDEDEDPEEGKKCGSCSEGDDEGSEGCDGKSEEEKTDEAAMLTFKSGKGYVLVKEGSELVMGNRLRARATLTESGFAVTAEQLDKAADGQMVVL